MASKPMQIYNVTEPFLECHCKLGEGPYYDEPNNLLRFVAPMESKLHFIDLEKGPDSHKVVDTHGKGVTVTANIEGSKSHFAFAGTHGFGVWDREKSARYTLKDLWSAEEKASGEADKWGMNDGAVDSKGRFWAGAMTAMEPPSLEMKCEGWLVRFDARAGTVTRMIESIGVPNGISWSLDDKTMYYTDTIKGCVHAYDYEAESGAISNKRVFWTPGEDDDGGLPDGHAMDAEGHLWIALFFGSKVVRVSPQGNKVAEIRLPTRSVTCPAFGGKDFDELYITTASDWTPDTASPENLKYQGDLFKCKLDVKGRRPNLLKLDLAKLLAQS